MKAITRFGPQAPMSPSAPPRIYECGICGCYHPWDWDGDCRDNANRYASPEDYADRNGITDEIEVRSWDERTEDDL